MQNGSVLVFDARQGLMNVRAYTTLMRLFLAVFIILLYGIGRNICSMMSVFRYFLSTSNEKTTKSGQYPRGIIVKIAIKCIQKRTKRAREPE